MGVAQRVPLRRSRSRCVRRIRDIVHVTNGGPKVSAEDIERQTEERHTRRELTRPYREAQRREDARKEAAEAADMQLRLAAMGMVIRTGKQVA